MEGGFGMDGGAGVDGGGAGIDGNGRVDDGINDRDGMHVCCPESIYSMPCRASTMYQCFWLLLLFMKYKTSKESELLSKIICIIDVL